MERWDHDREPACRPLAASTAPGCGGSEDRPGLRSPPTRPRQAALTTHSRFPGSSPVVWPNGSDRQPHRSSSMCAEPMSSTALSATSPMRGTSHWRSFPGGLSNSPDTKTATSSSSAIPRCARPRRPGCSTARVSEMWRCCAAAWSNGASAGCRSRVPDRHRAPRLAPPAHRQLRRTLAVGCPGQSSSSQVSPIS